MPVDLLQVLPEFDASRYTHLLPSLDKALITTNDLITLDPADVAKRAQVPVAELRKLTDALIAALHRSLGFGGEEPQQRQASNGFLSATGSTAAAGEKRTYISTLDTKLDEALGGGIAAGYLVEVTGESGAGKTQLLLTLLLAAQLPAPHGLSKSAIYISTEAQISTKRLAMLLSDHPALSSLPPRDRPSLSKIMTIQTPDLESQEHILNYQLPVAIKKHNVGLVVIDSVAANFRAEFEKKTGPREGPASMAKRGAQLVQLGALLRNLARTEGVAIVVANQVADRFPSDQRFLRSTSRTVSRTASANSQRSSQDPASPLPPLSEGDSFTLSNNPLSLDHQQRWFTGWGDDRYAPSTSLKTPSLGLVWTNQIAARIALVKQPVFSSRAPLLGVGEEAWNENESHVSRWRRWFKVVFAPWAPPSVGRGVEFEVVRGGMKHIERETS